jgi:hypothetical protein
MSDVRCLKGGGFDRDLPGAPLHHDDETLPRKSLSHTRPKKQCSLTTTTKFLCARRMGGDDDDDEGGGVTGDDHNYLPSSPAFLSLSCR